MFRELMRLLFLQAEDAVLDRIVPVKPKPEPEPKTRTIVSGGSFAPYYSCSHQGCYRKAKPHIESHDCCNTRHTTEHLYMERDGKDTK